jgi:hypothetical protein
MKIFIAIRSVFAYSEDSSGGSGAVGTLPNGNPGLPEKACTSAVLWAFVSLPDAAALKGSKLRGCKATRVGKESFSSLAVVCEKAGSEWPCVFSFLASMTIL